MIRASLLNIHISVIYEEDNTAAGMWAAWRLSLNSIIKSRMIKKVWEQPKIVNNVEIQGTLPL